MKTTTKSKPTSKTKTKSQPIKMTKQEIKEWDDLYQYVRSEIFQYSTDMTLSKHMVMRLKGLREGKFYANKTQKSMGNYPYPIILLTFKLCKQRILNVLVTKNFKLEQNKINYIMAIVENNINDVVLKLKAKEKSEKKTENLAMTDYEIKIDKETQKPQSKKMDSEIFTSLTNDLW